MTVQEFVQWLTTTFPDAEWSLNVDASVQHQPAHQRTLLGQTHEEPLRHHHQASYRLIFTQNFFDKHAREQTFEAPSLQALQTILHSTFHDTVEDVCKELESL